MSPCPNWLYSVLACMGFIMAMIPLPWHLQAWNTGTCLYMAWVGVACFILFVNSVVWNGNAINWAPVWCDITSKILIGVAAGIPASSLCIMRRLYNIASVRSVTITRDEKRRVVMLDLATGIGYPVVTMILHYIIQGHRFNIYEDVGCWFFVYNTWAAYVLFHCPSILVSFISVIYAVLTIRTLNQTRAQSSKLLSGYSNLTSSRYFRLMALASTEIIISFPVYITILYFNLTGAMGPFDWARIHYNFSRVDLIPAVLWRSAVRGLVTLELLRWFPIFCAFMFFGFFGFADEAMKNYRLAYTSVSKRIGLSTGASSTAGTFSSSGVSKDEFSSNGSLPYFGKGRGRKLSQGSITDGASFNDISGFDYTPTLNEKPSTVGSTKKQKNEIFSPHFHYDTLALPDIGGTLADNKSETRSIPSDASSLTIPESVMTRSDAGGVDVSSLHRASRVSLPEIQVVHIETTTFTSRDSRRNSQDIV